MKIYFTNELYSKYFPEIHEHFLKQFERTKNKDEAEIIVCGVSPVDMSFPKCKYIICNATNINHIKTNKKIIYLKDTSLLMNVTSTAEHTLFLLLSLCKRSFRKGEPGYKIKDKLAVIIGYGRIGRQVKVLLEAFGCETAVFDKEFNIEEHASVIKKADIITLHNAVRQAMLPIVSDTFLANIKNGTYIVNTTRPRSVDELAILKHIHRLGGYAADFIPRAEGLSRKPNTFFTNHTGGFTIEDMKFTSKICFDLLMEELNENETRESFS